MTLQRTLGMTIASACLAVTAPALAERSLDKEVVVAADVDRVWDAWTTREGITSFFAPDAVVEPRAGGAFHVYMDPGAPPGQRGADDMRFMALQPKRMLSFDWNAPPY
ncbi:MAG: SRPBCC domain-containing protein [Rubrivivax sp.]|nr:SRPBCC domain-containing protein [Rubrivivax sp.]